MSERAPVVLLVDDEERILSALRRTLRREGYELLTAQTPAQALAILDERPVDLVVSDQKMPGLSGVDLLAQIGQRRPGIPRILLTGWPEEIPAARLREVGVHALLPKPWDDTELKSTLRKLLAS
jgi:response regulator RpfG family c-di-GMP phosphodiesterase